MLGKRPELQIVAEVTDGLEAVKKVDELQPDLIILDIGLPSLNGIETARRIRKVYPVKPALGLAPIPVAPSSRISPPAPVAAPGKGEIAVG